MPDQVTLPVPSPLDRKNTPADCQCNGRHAPQRFLLVEEYHHDKRSQHRIHEMKGGGHTARHELIPPKEEYCGTVVKACQQQKRQYLLTAYAERLLVEQQYACQCQHGEKKTI